VPEDVACTITIGTRNVKASYPSELSHVDLTAVPTAAGFWVPWLPHFLPQSWPFCWWVAVVVDHVSRAVVALRSTSSLTRARSSGAIPGRDTAGIAPFAPGSVLLASMGASRSWNGSFGR